MGNSPPHLIKLDSAKKSDKFPLYYVCSYLRGNRGEQEDAHIHETELTFESQDGKKPTNLSYFGVFDGHSGKETSDYISKHLVQDYLLKDSIPAEVAENEETLGDFISSPERISQKFLECDKYILEDKTLQNAGSTGVSVFLRYKQKDNSFEVICANVGDSRAVSYDCGEVRALSLDHKPSLPEETARIEKAGHFVSADRVDGQLALSRSFGDKKYKVSSNNDPTLEAVIAKPDFQNSRITLTPPSNAKSPYKFLLLGCDGVWDVMRNNEACEFVAKYLDKFDIFNPEVKVPAYYHELPMMSAAKQKGDDWVYTPIEFWTNDQYDQWEHTIPTPYPVFNGCYSVLQLAKIMKDQLSSQDNNFETENNQQLRKLRKMYNNIIQLKEHHDRMEKLLREKPLLTTVEEKLAKISEIFLDEVVLTKRSNDNVSIIIVLIDNHESIPAKATPSQELENEHKIPWDLNSKLKEKEELVEHLNKVKELLEKYEKAKPMDVKEAEKPRENEDTENEDIE